MAAILWVTDGGTIATAEDTLYDYLAAKHTITVYDSSSSVPASYETTYDMVIISGVLAAGGTNPGNRYKTSTIPVLVMEGEAGAAMELGSDNVTSNVLGTTTPNEYSMWTITGTGEHTIATARGWTDNSYIQIVTTAAGANPSVNGMVKGAVVGEQIIARCLNAGQQFLIDYPSGITLDDSTTSAGKRFYWGMQSTMQYMNTEALATVDAIIVDYWGFTEDTTPQVSGTMNGGGGISASVTKVLNQIVRPTSTVSAGTWDTGPTNGQSLHGYTSDESDATYIYDPVA